MKSQKLLNLFIYFFTFEHILSISVSSQRIKLSISGLLFNFILPNFIFIFIMFLSQNYSMSLFARTEITNIGNSSKLFSKIMWAFPIMSTFGVFFININLCYQKKNIQFAKIFAKLIKTFEIDTNSMKFEAYKRWCLRLWLTYGATSIIANIVNNIYISNGAVSSVIVMTFMTWFINVPQFFVLFYIFVMEFLAFVVQKLEEDLSTANLTGGECYFQILLKLNILGEVLKKMHNVFAFFITGCCMKTMVDILIRVSFNIKKNNSSILNLEIVIKFFRHR